MTAKPYDIDRQIKAIVIRKLNGDGYRRWITRRPRYYVFLWDWIDVEHKECVGDVELRPSDDETAQREFESFYRLKSFMFLKNRGFVLTLSTGASLDIVTEKTSIKFNPRHFTSDRAMPFVDIVWQARGKRDGPFTSIVENHVTLTFRNRAHMDRYFKDGKHMPKALRHHDTVFLRRDDGYYDNSGSMLPVWIMLLYMMSDNDRQAFANNNASLSESMPSASAIEESIVGHTDEDYKSAVSPADDSSFRTEATESGANDRSEAASEQPAQQDVATPQQDAAPTFDSAPAMDSPSVSSGGD